MGSKTISETPFRYSKAKHVRRLNPGPYGHYSQYKPYLREEFGRQCVYCRMPDTAAPLDSFGVDHYQPKNVFPERRNDYSNLFYCCNTCNRLKGDFWPTETPERKRRFVPNPCDHVMWDHLRFRAVEVTARSDAGKFTLDLLNLNDEHEQGRRRGINRLLAGLFAETRKQLLWRKTLLDKIAGKKDGVSSALAARIDQAEDAIGELLGELRNFFPDLNEAEILKNV